jgi:hypothetical protein
MDEYTRHPCPQIIDNVSSVSMRSTFWRLKFYWGFCKMFRREPVPPWPGQDPRPQNADGHAGNYNWAPKRREAFGSGCILQRHRQKGPQSVITRRLDVILGYNVQTGNL